MIYIQIHLGQCDLYYNGLMIKMLQYKMYPAGELAVLRQLLLSQSDYLIRVVDTKSYT